MKKIIILTLAILPSVANAQSGFGGLQNVENIVYGVDRIVFLLVPIAFTLAVALFFWGLALYIFAQGSEDRQDRGKGIMTWGVIAIFVMSSIWGIVNFVAWSLGVQGIRSRVVPRITDTNRVIPTAPYDSNLPPYYDPNAQP
ncbi:hypothetical protein COB55_01760 [Candidatus Wolfebacteria bacterium]|nr:MAG: hypothetical protein COB55_01760 [Candidatus Wolfebacteria bacterium]